MTAPLSSQPLEDLYLTHAPPHEVLRVLDARGAAVADNVLIALQPVGDALVRALLDRQDPVIDVALARVVGPEWVEALLDRNVRRGGSVLRAEIAPGTREATELGSPTHPEVVAARQIDPDPTLAAALLSNRAACASLFGVQPWIARMRSWLAEAAPPELLRSLFGNPMCSPALMTDALRGEGYFAGLSEERLARVQSEVLGSPRLARAPQDDPSYDMTQHYLLQDAWALAVSMKVTPLNASILASGLANVHEFDMPYGALDLLDARLGEADRQDDRDPGDEASAAKAWARQRRFLRAVSAKWRAAGRETFESFPFDCDHIRFIAVSKMSRYSLLRMERTIFSLDDPMMRRAFYQEIAESGLTEECLARYLDATAASS